MCLVLGLITFKRSHTDKVDSSKNKCEYTIWKIQYYHTFNLLTLLLDNQHIQSAGIQMIASKLTNTAD